VPPPQIWTGGRLVIEFAILNLAATSRISKEEDAKGKGELEHGSFENEKEDRETKEGGKTKEIFTEIAV
jgi:hypothetical protein